MSQSGSGSRGPQRIVVLGAGFAGLWSAIGAARKLDELGIGPDRVEVTLVDRSAYHSIRVRNYEADLKEPGSRSTRCWVRSGSSASKPRSPASTLPAARSLAPCGLPLRYDRLVFALGSRLARPPIPGLDAHAFDVDTYAAGCRLNAHIAALPSRPPSPGRYTALVIGGGLTGIEAAAELPGKLRAAIADLSPDPAVPAARHHRRPPALDRFRHGRGSPLRDRRGARCTRGRDPARRHPCRARPGRRHPLDRRAHRRRRPWCGAPACRPTP